MEGRNGAGSQSREPPLMERALPGLFSSPHMAQERKMWSKMSLTFVFLLTAIIMGILSIYWGADHSMQFNYPVFTVSIIDFDGQEVGPFLQRLGAEARAAKHSTTLGYISEPGSKYNFSMDLARAALKDEKFWFGIVIQSNATTAMNFAYEAGNSSYDPTGSVQVTYEEGRGALAINTLALNPVVLFLNDFVSKFAKQKQAALAQRNAGNVTALALQAANPIPISFSVFNEAPYVPSTAEAATEIGTIYLIIISFISVLMFNTLHEAMAGKLPTIHYYIYRMLAFPTLFLFLSLLYLALSCAWNIRFDKFFGGPGYLIYWLLSWVSMIAFGLFLENVNNVFGQPYTPVFFVFWIITNIATGFYPVELLSNFYKWGLAWPLRHNLIASKAILFGTKNLLGLNFGVILAWVAVGLAFQPFTIWLQMRRIRGNVEKNRRSVLERVHGKERAEEAATSGDEHKKEDES